MTQSESVLIQQKLDQLKQGQDEIRAILGRKKSQSIRTTVLEMKFWAKNAAMVTLGGLAVGGVAYSYFWLRKTPEQKPKFRVLAEVSGSNFAANTKNSGPEKSL